MWFTQKGYYVNQVVRVRWSSTQCLMASRRRIIVCTNNMARVTGQYKAAAARRLYTADGRSVRGRRVHPAVRNMAIVNPAPFQNNTAMSTPCEDASSCTTHFRQASEMMPPRQTRDRRSGCAIGRWPPPACSDAPLAAARIYTTHGPCSPATPSAPPRHIRPPASKLREMPASPAHRTWNTTRLATGLNLAAKSLTSASVRVATDVAMLSQIPPGQPPMNTLPAPEVPACPNR